MRVVNCGYEYKHSENFRINRPNGTGDNIILIVRSKAFFKFNGVTEIVEPNTVVLLKKGEPQLYGAYGGEYVNDWAHFEADESEMTWISDLGIKFGYPYKLNDVSPLSMIILNMFSEMYSKNKNSENSANAYLHLLFFKLSDLSADKDGMEAVINEEARKRLESLRNELFRFPEREWNVEYASRSVSMSKSYFQHLYKLSYGISFISELTIARLERAKYLLVSTDYTVSAISELCGYHSGEHFMRAFKGAFDVTPTEYRTGYVPSDDKLNVSKKRPPFTIG